MKNHIKAMTVQYKQSLENLFHFQCGVCNRWWSIGDAPSRDWFCPWCGKLLSRSAPVSHADSFNIMHHINNKRDWADWVIVYNSQAAAQHKYNGYNYIVYSKRHECYKIGLSKDPLKRSKALGCRLIHTIKTNDMHKSEKILHWFFARKRATHMQGREWFHLSKNDVRCTKTIIRYESDTECFVFDDLVESEAGE